MFSWINQNQIKLLTKLKPLLALSLSLLVGCGPPVPKAERSKQEIRLNIASEPPTLDPRKASDTISVAILTMCFEGLMRSETEFAIAKEVKVSPDLMTYTFYLRDAEWSDGKPVTAHDFEETWKTILDPAFPSPFGSDLYIIKNAKGFKEKKLGKDAVGIKAIDDKTLQVELEHPVPFFLSLISTHCFFPVPAHMKQPFGDHFVSNGPFKLTYWRHSNDLSLEKNPHYWDMSRVVLEKIYLGIIQDETTGLSMFENNELDWAGTPFSALPLDAMPVLSKNPLYQSFEMPGVYYYIFNIDVPPFNNLNMRKAFTLAINRKEIIDNILQGKQSPATGYIPPMMWKGDPTPDYFKDADVAEARKYFALALKEMGKTAATLLPIHLSYNTSEGHHKIAQAIQEQWLKAFGVRVRLENKEWKVFLDDLSRHQFQIARMGGLATFNDPTTFLDNYKYAQDTHNFSTWRNPQLTELLEKSDRIFDEKERFKLLKEGEAMVISELPILPIYYYSGSYLKKPYIKGISFSELGDVDFKTAYIDKDKE